MKVTKWISGSAVACVAALIAMTLGGGIVHGQADQVRWDIVSVNFAVSPVTFSAGGVASALATDGSQITLTGTGTFVAPAAGGTSGTVTGGGTWATSGPVGAASGHYFVTGLVRWNRAPGVPNPNIDLIGNPAERSAGYVVLSIQYSDGSQGNLVVSCHVNGTPDSVFEGVTASKGFVDFFDRVHDVPGVDANRTLFHVMGQTQP